jgi:dihydrofolate reductase
LRLPVSILELPVRSASESGRIGWPHHSFEGDAMRKIVAGLMVSVDGVVEAPETWTGPYFIPEIGQVVGSVMADGDTMLLGRVTYQTFAASFAGNTSDPMAAQMNAVPKVVVSATLDQAGWENSTLIRRDVAQEITRLKEQPGRNINISGSATLVAWLLSQGLLDELNLLLFPVVVGHGKRLFGGEDRTTPLTLARSEPFGNGVVHLIYNAADGE